jgi:hypothetical protein
MTQKQKKVAKALEIRIANMPKGAGYKKPGSMNKKKTGYAKISK